MTTKQQTDPPVEAPALARINPAELERVLKAPPTRAELQAIDQRESMPTDQDIRETTTCRPGIETARPATPTFRPSSPPSSCPSCDGAGFYKEAVPYGHANF